MEQGKRVRARGDPKWYKKSVGKSKGWFSANSPALIPSPGFMSGVRITGKPTFHSE
jgi:hypothetical protein